MQGAASDMFNGEALIASFVTGQQNATNLHAFAISICSLYIKATFAPMALPAVPAVQYSCLQPFLEKSFESTVPGESGNAKSVQDKRGGEHKEKVEEGREEETNSNRIM